MDRVTEEERLKLMLNNERRARLQAEQRMLNMRAQLLDAEGMSIEAEGAALSLALRQKYGMEEGDSIEAATGVVKRTTVTPKPKLTVAPVEAADAPESA